MGLEKRPERGFRTVPISRQRDRAKDCGADQARPKIRPGHDVVDRRGHRAAHHRLVGRIKEVVAPVIRQRKRSQFRRASHAVRRAGQAPLDGAAPGPRISLGLVQQCVDERLLFKVRSGPDQVVQRPPAQ